MGEDWEKLLDDALERKRARAKSVRFTEFEPSPGEAPSPPEPPPAGGDENDELRTLAHQLERREEELTEENRRLRAELERRAAEGGAGRPAGNEEVERLKRELGEARAIIRSIEEAYRIGRRRSRR